MKDQSKAVGGIARAEKLTPERRSEIAKDAAEKRWNELAIKATHGSPEHPLKIGEIEIPCYVLEDGRRVLHQRGMVSALGMSRGGSSKGGGDRLANFVTQKTLEPFINTNLVLVTADPIRFKTPRGAIAYGYEATVLADICDAILEARKNGVLSKQQEHIAYQAEILVRGFARVGIIALVDEVTGYQELRDKRALQAILDKYLAKELAAWAKRFPDEFYEQMFRLKGWMFNPFSVSRPGVVGRYTVDLIYERLAPGLVEELELLNPKTDNGNRKSRHHQWLSSDIGHPALAQHIHAVMGLMRACSGWEQFLEMLDRAFPKKGHTIPLLLE